MLSQPFSKAAVEVSTSEIDPMDFDNGVAELDVSPNLFHKVEYLISRSLFSKLTASFGDYYV